VVRLAALAEAVGAVAAAPVVAAVRAAVAAAAREAGVAEAVVAVAEVAVQAEVVDLAEAVDRAVVVEVVEAVAAAGAPAAERLLLLNPLARAPELLVSLINSICSAGPGFLLAGVSHRSLIFSIHP
jgi:hypothetical protein